MSDAEHKDDHAAADADAHGHDAHGDSHAAPADIIPENSVQDSVLVSLAVAVAICLCGLMVYWAGLKTAPVEGEPQAQHEQPHEVQPSAPSAPAQ